MKSVKEAKQAKEETEPSVAVPAGAAHQVPGVGKYDFIIIFQVCGGILAVVFLVWLVFSEVLHLF